MRIAKKQGLKGEQIAGILGDGWSQPKVVYHQNIKTKLHPKSWELSRGSITRNCNIVITSNNSLVINGYNNCYKNWGESLAAIRCDSRPAGGTGLYKK